MSLEPSISAGEAKNRPQDKTVMIIDDDDSVRELLEFIVKKEGFKVDSAGDGEEAAEIAEGVRRLAEAVNEVRK